MGTLSPAVAGMLQGAVAGGVAAAGDVAGTIAANRSAYGKALKKYRQQAAGQLASGDYGMSPEYMQQMYKGFTRAQQAAMKGTSTPRGAKMSGQDMQTQMMAQRAANEGLAQMGAQVVAQSHSQAAQNRDRLERVVKEGREQRKEAIAGPSAALAQAIMQGGKTAAEAQQKYIAELAKEGETTA